MTAVERAQEMGRSLDRAAGTKIQAVDEAEEEFWQQVQNVVKALKQDVNHRKEEKALAIQQVEEKLQVDLATIINSCELATNVVQFGSDSDIISLYPSLSSTLQQLAESDPPEVDTNLGEIQLKSPREQPRVDLPSFEQLLCDKLHNTLLPEGAIEAGNQTTSHLPAETPPVEKLMAPSSLTSTAESLPLNPANESPDAAAEATNEEAALPQANEPAESTQDTTQSAGRQNDKQISRFRSLSRFLPRPVILFRKEWKRSRQFETAPYVKGPRGIAVHPNGEIVLTSTKAPVTVFSQNGDFNHVINGSSDGIVDIAVTPNNQYIIPGNKDNSEFYIYGSDFVLLKTIPTYDINNKPSEPRSVAVDSKGRIIVGLGWDDAKTVSIHQPDGTLISQFEKPSPPSKITCTPDDRLIISFQDKSLRIMDQSGRNARAIHPPPFIQSWDPRYVCCSKQRELFVGSMGIPSGVYRYVFTFGEYKYSDCIRGMGYPCGITLSADEKELLVAGFMSSTVTIFT